VTGAHGLPPYGAATSCPKCTCPVIGSTYCASQPQLSWQLDSVAMVSSLDGFGPACMLRTCKECGYVWLEQTADARSEAS
jgi:hypothetical protein